MGGAAPRKDGGGGRESSCTAVCPRAIISNDGDDEERRDGVLTFVDGVALQMAEMRAQSPSVWQVEAKVLLRPHLLESEDMLCEKTYDCG